MAAVYFLIALFATTAGAMTGMGGGVIIKPLLDLLGGYDTATIGGAVPPLTVLIMSLVSVAKQMLKKTEIVPGIAVPLALGSVAGGNLGNKMFSGASVSLSKFRRGFKKRFGHPKCCSRVTHCGGFCLYAL